MISITLSFLLYAYKTHVKRKKKKKKSPCSLHSARPCYTPQTAIIATHKIIEDCQKAKQINSENVVGYLPNFINRLIVQPKYHRKIIGKATWGEVIITEYESNTIKPFPVSKPKSTCITEIHTDHTDLDSYRNRIQK